MSLAGNTLITAVEHSAGCTTKVSLCDVERYSVSLVTIQEHSIGRNHAATDELYGANLALMDGTTAPVKRIIAEAEIVFGMWSDPTHPRGFEMIIIKGGRLLREVITSGQQPMQYRVNVIPCMGLEQAAAAKQMLVGGREFDA